MKILRHLTMIYPILTLSVTGLHAQATFDTHILTTNAVGAWSVYALDIDGDYDIDILSASKDDDKIAWYENDGNENFTPHVISTAADGAVFVHAADMDRDGDIDVVSTATAEHTGYMGKIAWYENDGNENFTTHYIITDAQWPQSGYAADLDSDGDMDILYCEIVGTKLSWCENDGNQNFTTDVLDTSILGYTCVRPADLDDDSDLDLVTTAVDDILDMYEITWFENDGNQNFTDHTITTTALGANWVHAVDLDHDADIDVLSASYFDNKIAWYENDGNEEFSSHTITTSAGAAWAVYAADLDNDSDTDVLSASAGDNKINWYENDGSQNFTTHTISTNALHASQVYAVDIDGDFDLDVIAPSRYSNRVYWYENQTATGIEDNAGSDSTPNQLTLYQNTPNPFNPLTRIEYFVPENTHVDIAIYDVFGRRVKTLVNGNKDAGIYSVQWDSRNDPGEPVNSGLYFYRIVTETDRKTRKMLLLK